jgi:hypothetical protein
MRQKTQRGYEWAQRNYEWFDTLKGELVLSMMHITA